MKARIALPVLAGALVAGFAFAQTQSSQQSSQSSSQTSNGSASSSSRASSSASAQAGGSKSASSRAGGSQSGTGSATGGSFQIVRPTHAIFYTPNPVGGSKTAGTVSPSLWEDQKKYYEMLGREGTLLYAGPWRDGNGAMLIVNCPNDQQAQNVADEDPVVKSVLYVANVRAWNVTYVGPGIIKAESGR